MKQDASENKLFNPLEMNPLFKSMLIIGFINLLFIGCTQPIPVPQTSLYKRLGGEKTLVAFSLQYRVVHQLNWYRGDRSRSLKNYWWCSNSSFSLFN